MKRSFEVSSNPYYAHPKLSLSILQNVPVYLVKPKSPNKSSPPRIQKDCLVSVFQLLIISSFNCMRLWPVLMYVTARTTSLLSFTNLKKGANQSSQLAPCDAASIITGL